MIRRHSRFAHCMLVALASVVTFAAGTTNTWFALRPLGTNKYQPISKATIGDTVFFIARGPASDGQHQLVLKVFDGAGRESLTATTTVEARDGMWSASLGCLTNPRVDTPGTWWFVFELDGEPRASRKLEVSP
jgi:hypothetical protein